METGKKDIAQQRLRVARWRELLAKLEHDERPDVLADARQLLITMERSLTQMEVEQAEAQERLASATTDEATLEDVERDTPM